MTHRNVAWSIILGWCVVVVVTSMRHEFFRDEVRALSLAMDARVPSDLPRLLQNEGQPMLWYLLLWAGYKATSSTVVLPVFSFLISGAAVWLVAFEAPFPRWLTVMFVFGRLPMYEYSVNARNYGLSMLLLFVFAWQYSRRQKHPILLGTALALLCNTNIHSVPLAGLLMGLWTWDTFVHDGVSCGSRQAAGLYVAMAIAAAGLITALVIMWPTDQIMASDTSRYTASAVVGAVWQAIQVPAGTFDAIAPSPAVAVAFVARVLHDHAGTFNTIALKPHGLSAFVASVLLVGSTLGLVYRPAAWCAALAGLLALSVVFQIVYPGGARHQGLFVVFLLTLYWIVRTTRDTRPGSRLLDSVARAGWYAGFPFLLAVLAVTGSFEVYQDLVHEKSASRALGSFLRSHPAYANAILIGEPDFFLESVRYYVNNPIYIVRERRFGSVVRYVRSAQQQLTMGELLRVAWDIKTRQRTEVLIVLDHLNELDPGSARATHVTSAGYGYGNGQFSWSTEELGAWNSSTEPLQQFLENVVGDERYRLYRLVAPPPH